MSTEIPLNPEASLKALTASPELTLGKMAVLCRLDSPILVGEASDIAATLTALWILAHPFDEVLAHRGDLETAALKWGETMQPAEYRERIGAAFDAVADYYEMLPRAEASPKKKHGVPGTGKSPSSASGSAGRTATPSTTSSPSSQRSRRRSCGAATRKAPEASKAARSPKTKSRSSAGE